MNTKVYYTESWETKHKTFTDYNEAILFQNERVEEYKDFSAKII